MNTYGYAHDAGFRNDTPLADQRMAIEDYCAGRFDGPLQFFTDDDGDIPFCDRPAATEMTEALAPGDRLVVANVGVLFSRRTEAPELLATFAERGVVLHVADGNGMELDDRILPLAARAVTACVDLDRECLSAAISDGVRRKQLSGGRWCRNPPLGFRWDGNNVLRTDRVERALMGRIVEMRDAGMTHTEIWRVFLKERIKTRIGSEWARSRIHRAEHAERRLQEAEAFAAEIAEGAGNSP